jgi:hypothetical protein
MKTSDNQKNLVEALFVSKTEFPRIEKNKRGQAGNRQFNYAPLDVIMDHIDPVLTKHGLMVTQGTDGHNLITRLEHVSGEWREISMPVNAEHANMQSYGIEITYRRRYSYQLIVGIVTEEDIDIKEKNRKSGIDHTDTKDAGGTDNPKREAFDRLQPEIQQTLRRKAPAVDQAIPDVEAAIHLAQMICDDWPDEDQHDIKLGLWYLLDSKTRTAIDKVQKQARKA